MKFLGFYTTFLLLGVLVSSYISIRLCAPYRVTRAGRLGFAGGILCIFLLTPANIMLRRAGISDPVVEVLAWVGSLGLGLISLLFTLLFLKDTLWLISIMLQSPFRQRQQDETPRNPGRRRFLAAGLNSCVGAAAVVLTGYGVSEARHIPNVKTVTLPPSGTTGKLKGFRIVQITDIHVSPTIRRPFVQGVVDVVNRLQADIVVLTGDLVDGSVRRLAEDVAPLGKIQSRYGNFFVTGNHEYYSGALEWTAEVERLGFTVLNNAHRLIDHGGGRIVLAGVTDYRAGRFITGHRSDPTKALSGAPESDMKILLAHQPKSIFEAAEAGFDLQISGHTHGGQFFPWNFLVGLDQPYVAGLHRHDKTLIYVSRGTGYWGPPMRLGSPSEITLIEMG